MKTVTITVSGQAMTGKTTLAQEIYKLLEPKLKSVKYDDELFKSSGTVLMPEEDRQASMERIAAVEDLEIVIVTKQDRRVPTK